MPSLTPMAAARYLLAFDLGTTGNKATLFDTNGRMVETAFAPYGTRHPRPGVAEQDPADWWRAVAASSQELLARQPDARDRIAAVGLCGMMNGCVLADDSGRAVRPAVIHADVRSTETCARVARRIDPGRAYDLTGCQLQPFFTAAKLAWLAENEPEAVAAARWCLQAKDWLAAQLTGQAGITDPSDASLTGLLDVGAGDWSAEMVDAARVPARLLPAIVPSTTVAGSLTAEAAQATGLAPGTPVVLGGGDGACATAGAGAVHPGDAYQCMGGTSWIAVVTSGFVTDPRRRVSSLCTLQPGLHLLYGTVQSAGSSVEWFLEHIGLGSPDAEPYPALDRLAAQAPAGCDGLLFLPYLQGERAPIWDASARGAFVGLSAAHTRAHLARAVLEGVAFALGSVLQVYVQLGLAPPVVRGIGGGMRSALWRGIMAAAYGRPVQGTTRLTEATGCGAAMAAGVGAGLFADLPEAARVFVQVGPAQEPDPSWVRVYQDAMARYLTLYPALAHCAAAVVERSADDAA